MHVISPAGFTLMPTGLVSYTKLMLIDILQSLQQHVFTFEARYCRV